ncbi:mandelate racemase/muconate lactonizing enzyme family protein [Rhodococcus opacus]|nr:mandelate racemase/muconate lactonizing enzyme family protein [Rhodococcus opacus]
MKGLHVSKIAAISTQLVPIPLESPLTPLGGNLKFRTVYNVVVHVDTTDGIRGSSYVWLPGTENAPIELPHEAAIVAEAVHGFADAVVGESVFSYERLWAIKTARTVLPGNGIVSFAHSALDMALWDAACKTLGLPLFRLLGAHKEEVDVYSNDLLDYWNSPTEDLVGKAKELVSEGFTSLKLPGGLHPMESADWDIRRLEAVRTEVGSSVELMLDVGNRWSFDQFARFASRIDEVGLRWIEDPVPLNEPELLLRVRRLLRTPIATGENSFDINELRSLANSGAVDVLIFEPMRIGGVTGSQKLAAICEGIGVPIAPHTYPELASHLVAGKPSGLVCEWLAWWQPMLAGTMAITKGRTIPSSAPGIGLTFDESFLSQFPTRISSGPQ